MKSLVLGAGGQLGSDLVEILPATVGLTHEQLSVVDRAGIESAIERHRPEVVFNCAAYNGVDRAETETALAFSVNSEGAFNVAAACHRWGIRLVHYSTNFVFDGELDRAYTESDPPNPIGAYARSKREGERRVLGKDPLALVIRTAALFGHRGSAIKGGSFLDRIVASARGGELVRVVGDQRVNPTYTPDLARASVDLVTAGTTGLVHMVAAGCCAWDELARAALEACGVQAQVETVTSAAFASPARRPANGCLDSERVSPLRSWKMALGDWAAARPRVEPTSP